MKKIKLIFFLFTSITIGQEFNSEFLDGTIVFKLNEFIEVNLDDAEKTKLLSYLRGEVKPESTATQGSITLNRRTSSVV